MLADTIVAAFILAMVMALVFGCITAGDRLFNQATLRQGLQSDLGRLSLELKRDVDLSDFWRATLHKRTFTIPNGGPTVDRDGLALVGLSDWDDTSCFDSVTSLPLWDWYVVYYATNGASGRLYRQIITPDPAPALPLGPYAVLAGNMNDSPGANDDVYSSMTISSHVQSMTVGTVMTNGSLTVKVHLRREGLKRANTNQRVIESLESTLTVRPKNTWPKI